MNNTGLVKFCPIIERRCLRRRLDLVKKYDRENNRVLPERIYLVLLVEILCELKYNLERNYNL
jgi:hypothetical protein